MTILIVIRGMEKKGGFGEEIVRVGGHAWERVMD